MTEYKKLACHEDDVDIEVQKSNVKVLSSENNSGAMSSYVTAAFVGAFIGLLLCGPTGMLIGFALGYWISRLGACKCACKCLMITATIFFVIFLLGFVAFFGFAYFG